MVFPPSRHEVILVFLSLTVKSFHAFFCCFHFHESEQVILGWNAYVNWVDIITAELLPGYHYFLSLSAFTE